jgi:TIR domain
MSEQPAPHVFLSHSHVDKTIARRVRRWLIAHGVEVWIDERKMKIGTVLPASIRENIEKADVVLVIASAASAKSEWVERELNFAKEHGKTIVPLLVESVANHPMFRDYLGADATNPQAFARTVDGLTLDLYGGLGRDMPAIDRRVMEAGLRELAEDHPNLAPLVLGCLDGLGLHRDNTDTVLNGGFHPLDEAVNGLFELGGGEVLANLAALAFHKAGGGVRALTSWTKATGDGGDTLADALGTEKLDRSWLPTAINLLEACKVPNNKAIYGFIDQNAAQLDDAQRRAVIRLVTWPVRTSVDRFGDVLAWVAVRHFPDAPEIKQMWVRLIRAGAFDTHPAWLARYTADAQKDGLPGWDSIYEAYRDHVRRYLRSQDATKVFLAILHIQAAADEEAPVLGLLLREASTAYGSSEWAEWEKRDPDQADLKKWHIDFVCEEATGKRHWHGAHERAAAAFEQERLDRRGDAKQR